MLRSIEIVVEDEAIVGIELSPLEPDGALISSGVLPVVLTFVVNEELSSNGLVAMIDVAELILFKPSAEAVLVNPRLDGTPCAEVTMPASDRLVVIDDGGCRLWPESL